MIPIDYSSVRPGFKTIPPGRCHALYEAVRGKTFDLCELGLDETVFRMKQLQRRGWLFRRHSGGSIASLATQHKTTARVPRRATRRCGRACLRVPEELRPNLLRRLRA